MWCGPTYACSSETTSEFISPSRCPQAPSSVCSLFLQKSACNWFLDCSRLEESWCTICNVGSLENIPASCGNVQHDLSAAGLCWYSSGDPGMEKSISPLISWRNWDTVVTYCSNSAILSTSYSHSVSLSNSKNSLWGRNSQSRGGKQYRRSVRTQHIQSTVCRNLNSLVQLYRHRPTLTLH